MRISRLSELLRWWSAAAIVVCVSAADTWGKDPEPSDHPVVLRISSEVLNSFVDEKEVERQLAVQEDILGTAVFGTALVNGTPAIVLQNSPDKARFWITLKGTVSARSTGYNGPAIVQSRALTNFSAYRLVTFEPGKGFVGSPVQISAATRLTIDGVGATRGGLIGRIVRRRASRTAAGQQEQVQAIIRERTSRRVQNIFLAQSDMRLAKMNAGTELKQLTQGNPMPEDLKYFCCTTPHYLQIASQTGDSATSLMIPEHDPTNPLNAPIEIWMHNSLADPRFAAGFDMLHLQAEKSPLGMTVAAAARLLSIDQNATSMIPDQLGQKPIVLQKVQDWRVAKLQMRPKEIAQVVQVLRPDSAIGLSGPRGPTPTPLAQAGSTQRTAPVASRPEMTHQTPSSEARVWTSGVYSANARFLALEDDFVRLERTSGVKTRIRFDKLSAIDQNWIRRYVSTPPLTAGVPPADQD